MLPLLSFRLVLSFVAAGLSDVAVIVLRPGRARRVALVRRRRSCQWSAFLGLCGGPYGPSRPPLVAVGRPLRCLCPLGVFCRGSSVFGVSACQVVALLPALCLAGFVDWPSSTLSNGRLVLLLDVIGRGGRLGSVQVVPVALGRHGMLCRCTAPFMVGRALALLGLPLGGACPGGGGGSFENLYDLPCPALQPVLQAQPVILYIAVPFGFPFSLACADRMYTPVGGKAPSVLFGASPCSLWEPQGAVPAGWCGVRTCPLASCLGLVRGVAGSLCSVSCRYPQLRWCVRRCRSAVAGGQGGLAWWHAGL